MSPPPRGDEVDFAGDERFAILGRVGAGGMGVVYKALDKERGGVVAVKTLRALGPGALFRLKQEFRALADVTHPNLAALHELCQSGTHWFLTMEFVEGQNFLAWVRSGGELAYAETRTSAPGSASRTEASPASPSSPTSPASSSPDTPQVVGGGVLDVARLRESFAQLAVGVAALHAAGKLHRDIKPSNVLVTPEGRVVLLDFGLVTELKPGAGSALPDGAVGTAGYMAPEQGAGGALGEASDWYAAGVMLYEALTGRRPFLGPPLEVLVEKRRRDPVPPRQLAPDLPEDLERLCLQLLERDPARRPAGAEILHRLGVDAASTPRSWGRVDELPLVGRTAELAGLEQAFEASRRAATIAVIHGPSGIGKSRLARGFLEGLRGRALVLSGRCYERESVPFKAVDSLMDALCNHLLALPRTTAAALLPADASALARVFPVLERIGGAARWQLEATAPPDVAELRGHAFAALRELCARLAARTPLVLFVDDLQWGDADSGALLDALLAPPDPPPLLLVGCHRAEDLTRRPLLRTLLAARPGVSDVDITLGPLGREESRELAGRLCGDVPEAAETAAREAGGNPFFVLQLAQLGHTPGPGGAPAGLDEMLHARLATLSPQARRLLAVIALAAVPIPQAVALAAAELPSGDSGLAELEHLRAARLVRTDGAKGRDAVECYHDRIREAAAAETDAAERRHLHGRLAQALERDPSHAEALADHFHEAGDVAQAAHWAAIAAARATANLAFDRAAELYRRALVYDAPPAARRDLHSRLGDALVAAGRGEEAARAYLEAARGADAALALAHRHKAAEQLLHSGHTVEGQAVLAEVLAELGLRAPATPAGALASLMASRARLALGGHRYRERPASAVSREDLLRIDVCWSAMTGYSVVSSLRAFAFQARHAVAAFAAGEPGRLAVAFAGEAFIYAHDHARAAAYIERAYDLAGRAEDPSALPLVQLLDGWRYIDLGSWQLAREKLALADQLLRERTTGQAWARDTAQIFQGVALSHQGHHGELRRHIARILRDARVRGDLYLSDSVPYHLYLADLAADEPGALRDAVRTAVEHGLPRELGVQHWGAVQAEACADLYEGRPGAALARVEAAWPGLRRSLLLLSVAFRREAHTIRGRTYIAAVLDGDASRARIAGRMARALEQDKTAATRALGVLLSACLLRAQGRTEAAAARFDEAADGFAREGMVALAAAARWRRGELLGGTTGMTLVEGARAALLAEGVRNPEKLLTVLAPAR